MMNNVRGEHINENIPTYYWKYDLIYFDGPLLSLFIDDKGNYSIFFWVDCDDEKNRWIIIDVTRTDLTEYLLGNLTLLDCIKNARSILVIDSPNPIDEQPKHAIKTTIDELVRVGYSPTNDSFLTEKISNHDKPGLAAIVNEINDEKNSKNLFIQKIEDYSRSVESIEEICMDNPVRNKNCDVFSMLPLYARSFFALVEKKLYQDNMEKIYFLSRNNHKFFCYDSTVIAQTRIFDAHAIPTEKLRRSEHVRNVLPGQLEKPDFLAMKYQKIAHSNSVRTTQNMFF